MFFEKQTVFACSFLDILPQKGEKVKTGRPEFGRKAAAKTNKAKRSEKTERKVSPAFGAKLRLNAKKQIFNAARKAPNHPLPLVFLRLLNLSSPPKCAFLNAELTFTLREKNRLESSGKFFNQIISSKSRSKPALKIKIFKKTSEN